MRIYKQQNSAGRDFKILRHGIATITPFELNETVQISVRVSAKIPKFIDGEQEAKTKLLKVLECLLKRFPPPKDACCYNRSAFAPDGPP